MTAAQLQIAIPLNLRIEEGKSNLLSSLDSPRMALEWLVRRIPYIEADDLKEIQELATGVLARRLTKLEEEFAAV